MYFKIKNNIVYRQYDEYGYITDNSMFGYRMLTDNSNVIGEKYVSQSGAVMLGVLSKTPQHIASIVQKLLDIFIDVEYEELKQDTIDFFLQLVHEGYLSCGETESICNKNDILKQKDSDNAKSASAIKVENVLKKYLKQLIFSEVYILKLQANVMRDVSIAIYLMNAR